MTHERFSPEEVARFENTTWSRCATTYVDGFGALVSEAIVSLLDEVKVGEGDQVLDVGTGPGQVAAAAAARSANMVGIDFSESMLATARRFYPHIKFQTASAESLPFDDGSFDAVVGNFVLHHSGKPDEVLRHAFRVFRKGGRVGFTVWANLSKLEAFGLFFAVVEEHAGSVELPNGPLFGVSDFDVFHQMVGGAGFRDLSVRELPIMWRTPSLDSYLAAFRDWANLNAFPKQVRDKIETIVRERAGSYWSGDVFAMPNPALLISVVK
ncbi:MAG: methyltransferase domain-containing protein [Chloroflexales bacterium]|nr:methyltransferase domain-containing protein [Chloroflexales bacterium]